MAKNYAFIDNQNLNLGIQKNGWKMDWRKFRAYLRREFGVECAYMFIGYMPENEDLYNQMHDSGYLVVLKPTLEMFKTPAQGEQKPAEAFKTYGEKAAEDLSPEPAVVPAADNNPAAQRAVKGNVDAELVLWATKEMPNYDKAVIISGDGDFFSLVEYLKEKNKLLSLMVPNRQYSTLLRQFDSYVVRLDQKRRQLAYLPRRKPVKNNPKSQ
ncbi:MAG TPA: NYN domain-containing protein [Candidatus Binatia bacterium]|nr:NYN domain-containing protein [Candidatus Binatia bacterium]